MPTPHAEEVLSVHLRVPSLAPGGCVALAQGPTQCTRILAMPDSVTAKRQRNTLLCVCVRVCMRACVRAYVRVCVGGSVCMCAPMYSRLTSQKLFLILVHTTELFRGTVPGTVLRKVHTAQLQLFQESIIIII